MTVGCAFASGGLINICTIDTDHQGGSPKASVPGCWRQQGRVNKRLLVFYIGIWRVITPTTHNADAHPRPAPKAITSAPRKFCMFGVKVTQVLRLSTRPGYSITSSARPSSVMGTVMPSERAVFKLTTSSTFVACCTASRRACRLFRSPVPGVRRADELWRRFLRCVPAGRHLHRPHSQGR